MKKARSSAVLNLKSRLLNSVIAIVLAMFCFSALAMTGSDFAQIKQQVSELLSEGDIERALDLINRKIDDSEKDQNPEEYLRLLSYRDSITLQNDVNGRIVSHANQIKNIDSVIERAIVLSDQKVIADEYYFRGVVLRMQGLYDSAASDFTKSIDVSREAGYRKRLLQAYYQKSVCVDKFGDFEESMRLVTEYHEMADAGGDSVHIQTALEKMGNILHFGLSDHVKALYYTRQALAMALKIGLDPSYSYGDLGSIYLELDSLPQAEAAYRNAVKHAYSDYELSGFSYYLGEFYLKYRVDYDSAFHYFLQAETSAERIQNTYYLAYAKYGLSEVLQQMEQYYMAEKFLNESLEIIEKTDELKLQEAIHKSFADVYKVQRRFEEALVHYEQMHALSDSLMSAEKYKAVSELETKYQSEQNEQQIELLSAENELKASELARQATENLVIQIIAALLFCFVLGISYMLWKISKAKQLIKDQKDELQKSSNELRATNAQLSELTLFKEGMTNMIAHDMKNTLSTIIGLSSIGGEDDRMDRVNRSGRLMLNLVTNMLDVQKFEEAEVKLEKEEVQLKEIFEEARLQVLLLLQMKSLRFEERVEQDITVFVDRDLLVRVVVNLLTNAIKYSYSGKLIVLEAGMRSVNDAWHLHIAVVDQGKGIAEDQLENIFEKYWQASAEYSGQAASTGLGLTFCKLSVEAHGGKIYAESQAGQGTTIHISLPMNEYVSAGSLETKEQLKNKILEEELTVVRKYAEQLGKYKVYQVGELRGVLAEMKVENLESDWADEVEMAIYAGDQDGFDKLLTAVT